MRMRGSAHGVCAYIFVYFGYYEWKSINDCTGYAWNSRPFVLNEMGFLCGAFQHNKWEFPAFTMKNVKTSMFFLCPIQLYWVICNGRRYLSELQSRLERCLYWSIAHSDCRLNNVRSENVTAQQQQQHLGRASAKTRIFSHSALKCKHFRRAAHRKQ